MSKEVKREYIKRGVKLPKCKRGDKHHTQAFHRIVAGIKAAKKKGGAKKVRSPYAIATVKLRKAGKKIYK